MSSKFMGILLSAATLTCVLSGCSGSSENSGAKGESELSIYHLASDVKVNSYINDFSRMFPDVEVSAREFKDSDEMDKIVTNELNAGKGPDIIIFDSDNNIDALRLAKSGAFACLDERVKADSSLKAEDYLPGALEVGKVDGKQYLLPLTFTLPMLYYDAVPEIGLEPDTVITYENLISSLDANIERLSNDKDNGAIAYSSLMGPMMVSGDAVVLSEDNREVEYDDAKLEQMMKFAQSVSKETTKITNIVSSKGGNLMAVLKHFSVMMDYTLDPIHQVWITNNFYADANAENFQISAISQGDSKEVYASLSSYGAITKNAEDSAYDFLRIAMDVNPSSGKAATYGLSLNKAAIQEQINKHKGMTSTLKVNDRTIKMAGLPDKTADDLNAVINSITGIKIFNVRVMELMYDTFEPYFNEEKSYEDCLTEFKQKMNIYVTE